MNIFAPQNGGANLLNRSLRPVGLTAENSTAQFYALWKANLLKRLIFRYANYALPDVQNKDNWILDHHLVVKYLPSASTKLYS